MNSYGDKRYFTIEMLQKLIGLLGRNGVNSRGGRRFICYRKDEIIHGLVKCGAPLFRDMSLAKG